MFAKEMPERAGGRSQHDVVDRSAQPLPDLFDLAHGNACPVEATVRPDVFWVERRL